MKRVERATERNKMSYLPLRRLRHPQHLDHQGRHLHHCQSNCQRSHCHILPQRHNPIQHPANQRLTAPRRFFPGRKSGKNITV